MAEQTAEQLKQRNVELMGEELGEQYSQLWQEVAHLHLIWSEYCELFFAKSKRVELLNQAAGTFFRIVQDTLFEAVLLSIGRLTDPSKTAGKDNLTINNLPGLITDSSKNAAVTQSLKAAVDAAKFARDWRNRRLAHNDLQLLLDMKAKPLPDVSKKEVDDALKALSDTLNAVLRQYESSSTAFDLYTANHGARSLIYVLHDGVTKQDEDLKALMEGKAPERHYPKDL